MQAADTKLTAHERLAQLTDAEEVFQGLNRLLGKSVNSAWIAVYLHDREQRTFSAALTYGLPQTYEPLLYSLPILPGSIPHLKTLARQQQTLLLSADTAAGLAVPSLQELLGNISILVVPMTVRNQLLGFVLMARSNSLPPLTPPEAETVREMVSHAAIIVSHIRLFDESLEVSVELAKRIDVILTLDEINKAISSSLSPATIIETAIENIERIIWCNLVATLVENKGKLVVMAVRSEGMDVPSPLLPGTGITRQCIVRSTFTTGQSRYIPALGKERKLTLLDRTLASAGLESLLAIPLIGKGRTSGVLLLGDKRPGQLAREDAFAIEKIAAQMAVALDNARLFEEMRALFISTVATLANAIDAKSPWTKGHSERVMRLCASLAQHMGLSEEEVERVRLGGLLHDIGKIGVRESVLEKAGHLIEDEVPPMRLHPEKGVAILAPIDQLKAVLPGILHHHERYDGTGYPHRLKGKEIPLQARIISVVDAYDAMVAIRPYKEGRSQEEAVTELKRCAGSQFDPEVVESFLSYLERKKGRRNGAGVRPLQRS